MKKISTKKVKLKKVKHTNTPAIVAPQGDNEPKTGIHASLRVANHMVESFGNTIIEALNGLSIGAMKGRGILVLEKGGLKKEKVLSPFMVNRYFGLFGSMHKEIVIKQLSQLFDSSLFERIT